jgi:CubicO group peptidase (beta-lactamase class C family)
LKQTDRETLRTSAVCWIRSQAIMRSFAKIVFPRALAVCFSISLVSAQTAVPEAASSANATGEDVIVSRVAELVAAVDELDMFSGVVLVAKDGIVIYENAVGEANKDHNVPNRYNTRFVVGSIGKTFTAVAIMQLAEAGKLYLTDPINKYLSDFPFDEKDEITINDLLTHSAGLGDYLEHDQYSCKKHSLHKIDDALPLVYSQPLEFSPGEKYQYSNSGYLLLGAIIEKVSGLPYPEYLREQIFQPLGMAESGIVFEDEVVPNRARGYTKHWDGSYTSNVLTHPAPCAAGGLTSTAHDLLKFDQALYDTTLLTENSKAQMFTVSKLKETYAYGWEVKEYAGNKFVGHSGGADGVEAFFYRFVDAGYTIITLANYDGGNGEVCSTIEAILFGQEYSVPTVVDANFALGYFESKRGMHREAIEVWSRNLENNPPHFPSLFFRANSRLVGNFEFEEAIDDLERYIQESGKDALFPLSMAWTMKGTALKKLGRTAEAIDCFKKTLELDPENTKATDGLEELKNDTVKK